MRNYRQITILSPKYDIIALNDIIVIVSLSRALPADNIVIADTSIGHYRAPLALLPVHYVVFCIKTFIHVLYSVHYTFLYLPERH